MNKRVRFWAYNTGLRPQYGTIYAISPTEFGDCAEIAPDDGSEHVYLFQRAVWGYELIKEEQEVQG